MKTTILFDFKLLSKPALLAFGKNVLTRTSGNPNFAGIQSPLIDTELASAVSTFETALQEAADGSRPKISEKNTAYEKLVAVLEKTGLNVVVVANGNLALILEAGFNVSSGTRVSPSTPDQVTGVRTKAGTRDGEGIIQYNTVKGARIYAIEWSLDNGVTWTNGAYSTTRQALLTGLPIQQTVMIRVYALGAGQRKGAYSEPVRLFLI